MSKKSMEDLRSIFKDLYSPEFVAEDIDLKEFYSVAEKQAKEDIDRTYANIRALKNEGLPRSAGSLAGDAALKKPLNREEAQIIEDKKDEIFNRALGMREELGKEITKIDEECSNWSHSFELKSRPRLRKAIKRIFGDKKETLTYEDYKELLILKKQLEVTEASDIMKEEEDSPPAKDDSFAFIKKFVNIEKE